ncbi:MAG: PocR ligand-binding domain-containing protein [Desulfovibrionaceae bacterium]|nr:PocR ligand-binding domain-containing protein [Desulfovibrionaceae bacterium]MBF0513238.1 PocR ligand-binding domain-containing protein [Desulfovibrionaceae bacterium]
MEMTDICPATAWAALEEDIHRRFGLNARIYDSKGFSFTGHVTWGNRLCPAVKASPQAVSAICSLAQTAMAAQARDSRAAVIDQCDAGLYKICVPVFAGDDFVGVAGGCGALPQDGEIESFLLEKSAGLSEDQTAELSLDVPVMDEAAAAEAAKYIEERVAALLDAYRAKQNS